MKNKSEQRAKDAAAAIAQIRKDKNVFDTNNMVELLRRQSCPYAIYIPSILVKQGILEKHHNMLHFKSEEPVYFGILKNPLDEVSKKTMTYLRKSKEKKSGKISTPKMEKTIQTELPQLTIEQMITALKSQGYKVFKPVTEFKEC